MQRIKRSRDGIGYARHGKVVNHSDEENGVENQVFSCFNAFIQIG